MKIRGTVSLNAKEQQRVMVLNRLERSEVTAAEAAALMGVTLRHARRLLARYRIDGVAAMAHGNRGRQPIHTLEPALRDRVVELARVRFAGCNHQHLTELLAEREGITLSRPSVWRILRAAGLKSARHRRPPKHRLRRERYPQEGMLLQLDGSNHDWLEGRGPRLTLIGAIDDATGTVPAALFREREDAHGYFLLLQEIIEAKGVPLAVYSDKHSIFTVNLKRSPTVDEDLRGNQEPTQFGRALAELGIQSILADSPQAKGRIERGWETFQDRLVSELRIEGARTSQEATATLERFIPRFNVRFSVPPASPGSAYHPLATGPRLEDVLCFKYLRTVAADNTLRFGGEVLQLLPSAERASYSRTRVTVLERLDGGLAVRHDGKTVASRKAPPEPAVLRARYGERPALLHIEKSTPSNGQHHIPVRVERIPTSDSHRERHHNGRKPAPDHPWRHIPAVTKSQNR
ncbi:MAG: ISNCY family transposase [Chloroflexi bacterium]|nr:ISNCY family transposase [Chloroflexota bacterium]